MMKFKLLIMVAVILLLPLLAIAASLEGKASAQAGNGPIRIEVSRFGFNYTPEEFRPEVEVGQEVVITFVYGDLPQQNPHRIFISGYNIQTDILDRENPEITVRFTATRSARRCGDPEHPGGAARRRR